MQLPPSRWLAARRKQKSPQHLLLMRLQKLLLPQWTQLQAALLPQWTPPLPPLALRVALPMLLALPQMPLALLRPQPAKQLPLRPTDRMQSIGTRA